MSEMIEVARSSVQTWECDQMGHMNVQFYVEKAGQGLAALSLALGLGPRYARNEGARLFVRDHHVRFLREQRPGAPFFLRAGVLEVRDFGLRVYEEMVSTVSGEPAASFIAEVELLDEETREVKPLPAKAKETAKKLVVELPVHGSPRGLEIYEPRPAPKLKDADGMGMVRTWQGEVETAQCDGQGFLLIRKLCRCRDTALETDVAQLFQGVQTGHKVRQRQHHQIDLVVPVNLLPEICVTWIAVNNVSALRLVRPHLLGAEVDPDHRIAPVDQNDGETRPILGIIERQSIAPQRDIVFRRERGGLPYCTGRRAIDQRRGRCSDRRADQWRGFLHGRHIGIDLGDQFGHFGLFAKDFPERFGALLDCGREIGPVDRQVQGGRDFGKLGIDRRGAAGDKDRVGLFGIDEFVIRLEQRADLERVAILAQMVGKAGIGYAVDFNADGGKCVDGPKIIGEDFFGNARQDRFALGVLRRDFLCGRSSGEGERSRKGKGRGGGPEMV